jgi:quercetin dioxygenase-like cupin family protein
MKRRDLLLVKRKIQRHVRHTSIALVWVATILAVCNQVFAQQSEYRGRIGQEGCRPISKRTGEAGCWIIVNAALGKLPPRPMFWHLDTYPTRAAAETAKRPHGAVVESFGKVWLFTIDDADSRPVGGVGVAKIGPLPLSLNAEYTARYMEAIFTPGMTSSIHRHPGPEVWYTLTGETCLETSKGRMVGRAGGEPVIVPGGLPMYLTATGTETRSALVLILYDSSQPVASPANDWTPKGLCKNP